VLSEKTVLQEPARNSVRCRERMRTKESFPHWPVTAKRRECRTPNHVRLRSALLFYECGVAPQVGTGESTSLGLSVGQTAVYVIFAGRLLWSLISDSSRSQVIGLVVSPPQRIGRVRLSRLIMVAEERLQTSLILKGSTYYILMIVS